MASGREIAEFKSRVALIKSDVLGYFDECRPHIPEDLQKKPASNFHTRETSFDIWHEHLPSGLRGKAMGLRENVRQLSIDVAGAARGAPLITEVDLSDLRFSTRRMLSAICFKEYKYYSHHIHHNEDVIVAVDPPSQAEWPVRLNNAVWCFSNGNSGVEDTIDLLSAAPVTSVPASEKVAYNANTAFIMMAINPAQPELDDVRNGIKDVCKEFGIVAETIDEGHFDDGITDRVLDAIESSELLIADLTGERPNVYYEIGHAHARKKRVHLFCKIGTKVHFDIQHRKYQSYANVTELKKHLRARLEAVTGKPIKGHNH